MCLCTPTIPYGVHRVSSLSLSLSLPLRVYPWKELVVAFFSDSRYYARDSNQDSIAITAACPVALIAWYSKPGRYSRGGVVMTLPVQSITLFGVRIIYGHNTVMKITALWDMTPPRGSTFLRNVCKLTAACVASHSTSDRTTSLIMSWDFTGECFFCFSGECVWQRQFRQRTAVVTMFVVCVQQKALRVLTGLHAVQEVYHTSCTRWHNSTSLSQIVGSCLHTDRNL